MWNIILTNLSCRLSPCWWNLFCNLGEFLHLAISAFSNLNLEVVGQLFELVESTDGVSVSLEQLYIIVAALSAPHYPLPNSWRQLSMPSSGRSLPPSSAWCSRPCAHRCQEHRGTPSACTQFPVGSSEPDANLPSPCSTGHDLHDTKNTE